MGAPQYEQAGADIGGTGTTNTIPRWTGPSTLGDSGLIDDGSVIYTTARNAAFGSTSSAGYRARVLAAAGAGSAFGLRIDAGTNSTDYALRIANQATTSDYLAVRGDGNVGIGTATPVGRADVAGTSVNQSGWGLLSVQSNDAQGADKGGSITFGGVYDASTATHWAQISGRKENGTSGQYGGYLAFATRTNGAGTNTERARIDSSGNVGIGTASPYARASVRGGSNDGIGVWSTAVTTAGSPIGGSLFLGDANFYNAGFYNQAPGLSAVFDVSTSVAAALAFYTYSGTNRIERARIDSAGNVGIGTASPISPLQVKGNATNTDGILTLTPNSGGRNHQVQSLQASSLFRIYDQSAGASRLEIDISGNVKVATTAAVFDASGTQQGLKLPATPGNADTQTLDAYNEATWPPTLAGFGGTAPTVTVARFVRIGRIVTVCVKLTATGGNQYSGTKGTTTLTVPSGATPSDVSGGFLVDGAVNNLGMVAAFDDGLIYLPTFALTTATLVFTITYRTT